VNHRENARNIPSAQTNHLHLGSLLPAMAMGNAIKGEHARQLLWAIQSHVPSQEPREFYRSSFKNVSCTANLKKKPFSLCF